MKTHYRDATTKYYKLCRAREEIERLNIEVGRLRSFICEETEHTVHVIEELSRDEPSLAAELRHQWILRSSINTIHLQRLWQLQCEPYYTGSQDSVESTEGASLEEEMAIEAETEHEKEFEVMTEFVANIAD